LRKELKIDLIIFKAQPKKLRIKNGQNLRNESLIGLWNYASI